MSGDLLSKGLELFATGDFSGAARAWVQARAGKSNDPQIDAYISHLRQLAPEVVAEAEASLSAAAQPMPRDGAPSDAAPGPAAPPAEAPPPAPAPDPLAKVPEQQQPPEHQPEDLAPIATPEPGPAEFAAETEQKGAPPETGRAQPASKPAAIELPAAAIVSSSASPSVSAEPPPGSASPPKPPAPPVPAAIAPAPIEIPVPVPPVVPAAGGRPPPATPSGPSAPPQAAAQPEKEAAPRPAGPWEGDAALGPAIEVSATSKGLGLVFAPAVTRAPAGRPKTAVVADEQELKELLELDDFTGALEVAERLLSVHPDHRSAKQAKARCRETLEQMYRSKIGDVTAVPSVLVSPEEVIWLDLDHRSGFLLAQVDGASTFEEIIELSGMDRLESLRIMAGLLQQGVIGVR